MRYSPDKWQVIASHLSEDDARAIAVAHEGIELADAALSPVASLDELRELAEAIDARLLEGGYGHCCLCGETGGKLVAYVSELAHVECIQADEHGEHHE